VNWAITLLDELNIVPVTKESIYVTVPEEPYLKNHLRRLDLTQSVPHSVFNQSATIPHKWPHLT